MSARRAAYGAGQAGDDCKCCGRDGDTAERQCQRGISTTAILAK